MCALDADARHSLVFPHFPHCLARPRRLLPPTVKLPFRAFSQRSCPSPLDAGTSFRDFRTVWRMRSERVHITPRVLPLELRSRVQDFASSSRVTPPPALWVYFTPLTPIGFCLQGFPLPRSRANSSPAQCRLAVLHRLASRRLVGGTFGARTLQFLGVGPVPFAGFTALFPLRVRSE